MKRTSSKTILCPLSVLLPLLMAGVSRAGTDPDTGEIMQQKLQRSQAVLRGLALQDFGLIQTNAQQLVKLSQFSGWHARQTPEYELFTVEFRRHAEELVKAAKNQNIDAATLAYTQLTFSCVSCHRSMRGGAAQKVSLPLAQPRPTDPKANRL